MDARITESLKNITNRFFSEIKESSFLEEILPKLEVLNKLVLYNDFPDETYNKIDYIISRLNSFLHEYKKDNRELNPLEKSNILNNLDYLIKLCQERSHIGYNTERYYEDKIENLKETIKNLYDKKKTENHSSSDVFTMKQDNENLQKQNDENLQKQNDDLRDKLQELNKKIENAQNLIKQYEFEKEESQKRDDAIKNWKNKISDAFKGLQIPINKLKQEHERLEILYKIYKQASITLVLLIILIDIIICIKIIYLNTYPSWEQYWTMILPVPVAIGLLWGFITQMNRAQRQMVVLARHIYEIEYIEGLLQALNTLSVDIGESMSKINEAISRLIDNHLRNMIGMHIDETTLQKLEKQDALPYEKIPELIKLLKNK